MEKFAKTGDFCPNEACPDYGKLQTGQQQNIKKIGKTKKGVQRYQCETCKRTFTETKGKIFYRRRTPEHESLETLALLAEGSRISSLSRVKGFKEDTILAWLRRSKVRKLKKFCWPTSESSELSWTPCGRMWATWNKLERREAEVYYCTISGK